MFLLIPNEIVFFGIRDILGGLLTTKELFAPRYLKPSETPTCTTIIILFTHTVVTNAMTQSIAMEACATPAPSPHAAMELSPPPPPVTRWKVLRAEDLPGVAPSAAARPLPLFPSFLGDRRIAIPRPAGCADVPELVEAAPRRFVLLSTQRASAGEHAPYHLQVPRFRLHPKPREKATWSKRSNYAA